MTTIPASQLVSVAPSVLAAGGSALEIVALILSTSTRVPIGAVANFADAESVGNYFGLSSQEKSVADIYFAGFSGSNKKPGSVLYAQYPLTAVAAYLRGGALGLTLAQLQALTGTLALTVNGFALTAAAINLSTATSFSVAAAAIQAALTAPASASIVGSIGGTVTASAGAVFTGAGSGGTGATLTATATVGVIHAGALLSGGTGVPAGTYIIAQISGTVGGNGIYQVSHVVTGTGIAITASSNVLDVTVAGSGTVQTGDVLSGTGVTVGTAVTGQLTGTVGGVGTYALSVYQQFASQVVNGSSTILVITSISVGTPQAGALVTGSGVTAATVITAQLTGAAGGTGAYRLSAASTVPSEAMTLSAAVPTVTYDSVTDAFAFTSAAAGAASTIGYATGTLSAALKLTAATGAVTSQGADAATPSAFMDGVIALTTQWVTLMTTFDPDQGSGNTQKLAFAAWKNTKNNRYAYVVWDTDITPTTTNPASSSLAQLLLAASDSGGEPIWVPNATTGAQAAAFQCGAAASIDFDQTNGRITFAYKWQDGLTAWVTDATVAVNLLANGYNFGGAYATAANQFVNFQNGQCTGRFAWFDAYINQIWLNDAFQVAGMNLMQQSRSIPYSDSGYSKINAAFKDVIDAGLNFGAFGPAPLSSSQIVAVNTQAGVDIATTLQTQGWYLQIKPAAAAIRAARTSPEINFWYVDQGSVQKLNLSSILVQ